MGGRIFISMFNYYVKVTHKLGVCSSLSSNRVFRDLWTWREFKLQPQIPDPAQKHTVYSPV